MENNSSSYHIIDEPKIRRWEHLIVNPVLIIFAGILVPIFWIPPLGGKFWMPLLWLCVNGYLLGSASFKKEVLFCVAGGLAIFASMVAFGFYVTQQGEAADIKQLAPYLRITLNGLLFTTLYLAAFTQSKAFNLFLYIRGRQ